MIYIVWKFQYSGHALMHLRIFCMTSMNKLHIGPYTLLLACTRQLCVWPHSLTENIRNCRLVYHTQVSNIRYEVNRAIADWSQQISSQHCTLYTMCAQTLPPPHPGAKLYDTSLKCKTMINGIIIIVIIGLTILCGWRSGDPTTK